MQVFLIPVLALFLGACSTMQAGSPTASILVDLDPASADRTVIVESITADRNGCSIFRIESPEIFFGSIPSRPNRLWSAGSRRVRSRAKKLTPIRPASPSIRKVIFLSPSVRSAKSCASGEAILIRRSRDWRKPSPPARPAPTVSSSTAKEIFSSQAAPAGSSTASARTAAPPKPAVQIDKTLAHAAGRQDPAGDYRQWGGIRRNGVLYVADTSRGAIWKVVIGADGKGGKPTTARPESAARRRRRIGLRSAAASSG